MKKILQILSFFLLFSQVVWAQGTLQVTPSGPANPLDSIIQTLVGDGVEVSDIQLVTGAAIQYGSYTDTLANGMFGPSGTRAGLIMTSGSAVVAQGPNNSGSAGQATNTPGFGLLNNLLPSSTTNDACVISFKVRTSSDTIAFNYAFGSEEYNSFVGSTFNDIFAFFISGPGIVTQPGLPPNTRNIAIIPGTTNTPVSINNVNRGFGSTLPSFPEFYINNTSAAGDQPAVPQPPDPARLQSMQYDGLTRVLTAFSPVQPCQEYTLTFAIADVGDRIYDSGVFIEAGSLRGIGVSIVPTSQYSTRFDYAVAGCAPGVFIFKRAEGDTDAVEKIARFEIAGTAINGVDYTVDGGLLADSVVIPAGADSVEVFINVVETGDANEEKTILLIQQDACSGEDQGDTARLFLRQEFLYETEDVTFCFGDSAVQLNVDNPFAPILVDEDNPPFEYTWEPAAGLSCTDCESPMAFPDTTTLYTLTVFEPLSGCVTTEELLVTVNTVPQVATGQRTTRGCNPGEIVFRRPEGYPNNFPYVARFRVEGTAQNGVDYTVNGEALPDSVIIPTGQDTLLVLVDALEREGAPFEQFIVIVPEDSCSAEPDTIPPLVIREAFRYEVQDAVYCVGDEGTALNVENPNQPETDEDPAYVFAWEPAVGLSCTDCESPLASPDTTTIYTLTVFDPFSGCEIVQEVLVDVFTQPVTEVLTISGDSVSETNYFACIGRNVNVIANATTTNGGVRFEWELLDPTLRTSISNAVTSQTDTSVIYANKDLFIRNIQKDVPFILRVYNDIDCFSEELIVVQARPFPEFTIQGPDTLCFGDTTLLSVVGTNVTSVTWDQGQTLGTNNQPSVRAFPTQSLTYTVLASNGGCDRTGQFSLIVTQPFNSQFETIAGPRDNVAPASYEFRNSSLGNNTFEWLVVRANSAGELTIVDSATTRDFDYVFEEAGDYFVTLFATNIGSSCLQVSVDTLRISPNLDNPFIPNVFTPNGDNVNETFLITVRGDDGGPTSLPVNGGDLEVYDRWGRRVLAAPSYQNDWRGGNVPDGTYYYRFITPLERRQFKGWVMIAR